MQAIEINSGQHKQKENLLEGNWAAHKIDEKLEEIQKRADAKEAWMARATTQTKPEEQVTEDEDVEKSHTTDTADIRHNTIVDSCCLCYYK